jgi:ATP-binding cassette subfamily B (MDR/TAP) protein 1
VGRCLFSGMMYGISYFFQYITIGLIFFFSAIFITNYSIEVSNSFAAIFLILFACTSAGNNAAFLGDLSKAKNGANNLFSIFELED